MNKLLSIVISSIIVIGFAGCGATKANKLQPQDVSKETYTKYEKFSCDELSDSFEYLENKVSKLENKQNDEATSDNILLSWGWVLYGVPYFWLDGDGETRDQYEVTLGKMKALKEIMNNKKCSNVYEEL